MSLPLPVAGESFSLPLEHPDPSSIPSPARPALTTDQVEKLESIINHFNSPTFELPLTLKDWKPKVVSTTSKLTSFFSSKAAVVEEVPVKTRALDDVEKCYLSREAFLRILRSRSFDLPNSVKRAEETIVWRRDFGVEDLDTVQGEVVKLEAATGKEIIFGYDLNSRPVLYMHPYRQNTESSANQIIFVVWCLERCLDLIPATNPPTETLALCIDFGSNRPGTKPQQTPLNTAHTVLNILQTYYCERLGKAVCINVPSLFWAFFKIVSQFVDPVTKEKITFLPTPDASHLIPLSNLQAIFGGSVNFEPYDNDTYLPALIKLCQERKAGNIERWRKYGNGKAGLSETIIRGAVVPTQA